MSMKKLAIALSMFALAGSITLAKAPIIGGIPDIVIGDDEGGVLTLDTNWFRTVDAFNVLDYVDDVDSPQSDLMFAFFEETTADDIGVRIDAVGATARTVTQINPADKDRPANWGANEITNFGQAERDYLLTFVDLIRSPEPYGSVNYPDPLKVNGTPAGDTETVELPWHNTEGASTLSGSSRLVWLYVADDELAGATTNEPTRVTGDAMNIISRNYAFDALQGGISAVTGANWNFATGAGTTTDSTMWTYSTLGGSFAACTGGSAAGAGGLNGYLSLTANVGNTVGFGRWMSKTNATGMGALAGAIPYVDPGAGPSLIYCARFTMSQNQTAKGTAPKIRLSALESRYLTEAMVIVRPVSSSDPLANPHVPDAGQLRTYKVVWSAQENSPEFGTLNWAQADLRTYNATFDILDQDADKGGTWTLYNVDVVTAPRPADVAPAVTLADFDAAGWTMNYQAGTAINITHNTGTGAVTFNDAGTPDNGAISYYMWKQALSKAAVQWTDNQLLRFKVALSCPTLANRTNFHWFRLREFTTGNALASEWSVQSDDGGIRDTIGGTPYLPPVAPSTHVYEAYMASQVDDPGTDWSVITGANFDVINVALDAISNHKRVSTSPPSTHQNPTAVTVHSVGVEILADNL